MLQTYLALPVINVSYRWEFNQRIGAHHGHPLLRLEVLDFLVCAL